MAFYKGNLRLSAPYLPSTLVPKAPLGAAQLRPMAALLDSPLFPMSTHTTSRLPPVPQEGLLTICTCICSYEGCVQTHGLE